MRTVTDLITTKEELEFINNDINLLVSEALSLARISLTGKDARLLAGEYKGRLGQIEHISYDHRHGFVFLVRPYALDNKGNRKDPPELLWNRVDARTYWPLDKIEIDNEVSVDNLRAS